MKVRVTESFEGSWYHVGEIYEVRDPNKYSSIGVQVYNSDVEGKHPDIIMNGHFEYIKSSEKAIEVKTEE